MELLWGRSKPSTRGPKPALDLERVVRAAIDLADAEGLEVLSMRRVAEVLEIGTMSLYTYVPGKGELLDLMVDTVYGEQLDAVAPDPATGLRGRLEMLTRGQWVFFERHPWTLSVATGRSVLGPNETASYERALAIVADLGLPAREAVAIVDALSLFVRGAARDAAEAAGAEQATGQSEYEWWTEREPMLDEALSQQPYPALTALAAAGGFDVPPDTENYNVQFIVDDFEFGLHRLLDGIEQYVDASARRADDAKAPRADRSGAEFRRIDES
jgi:AcrR family transcriptional regulator